MPRSSRHKSSKHGARDSRKYSESEDDLGVKERKEGSEEDGGSFRVSKDWVLSEKRKLDSKESLRDAYDGGSRNGECAEDYGNSSSRRRKERGSGDGVSERWNGGGENFDQRGEGSKKARGSDSKSSIRRREDEIEDVKRTGGRSEKHSSRESSRKEEKDKERERDRYREKDRERGRERDGENKCKGGKGDKFGHNEDERSSSKREITTDPKANLHVRKSNPDDVLERRNRKRRENSDDIYQDENGDVKCKHTSSEDGVMKVTRKNEKHGDEKDREKYRVETEKSRQDKYKDVYPVKDLSRSRSREKYSRDSKDHKDVKQKRMKLPDGDLENDFHSGYDHGQSRDRDQERDRGREPDGYWKHDQVCGRENERNPLMEKEREQGHAHDQEADMGLYDERDSTRDLRGRKLSPDDHNSFGDSEVKGSKALHTDIDKVSLGTSRVEAESRGDTCSRPAYVDISSNNNRSRVSPTSSSHNGDFGSRHVRQEDSKYRDLQMESRPKARSDKAAERSSNYRSSETHTETDDGHIELTSERSTNTKPSLMGLTDGSSSPSLDRMYMNRSGVRRSLDVEDAGRRSGASAGSRDLSVAEGKSGRDIDVYKSMVDDSSRGDSSFNSRQGQGNVNPPPFRPRVESPTFMGMMEEDSRLNSSSRYKRMGDPGMGRGVMNSWRGVPNWSSPLPNGFMPFQSGPTHGNFLSNLPHFPSPHIFSVGHPMEINHPGLPFPLADTDRFSGHLRPLGWPNMIDPSVAPRFHGWDVNNGVMRGESHSSGANWEHNRRPINAHEWENNVDMWKGHNGVSADVPSATNTTNSTQAQFPVEDGFSGQGNYKSHNENSHEVSELKSAENRPALAPEKGTPILSSEFSSDKKQVSEKAVVLCISQFYLSRLDVSEQLAHPEVYKQCIDLLDGKPGLTVANDPSVLMILTNDRRNGPMASDNSLSSSVLPSTNDSTFQKALELYKSQRHEMREIENVKVDWADSILPTDSNQRGVPTESEEKHDLEMDEEERLQSPHWTSDQDKIIERADAVKDNQVEEPSLESNNATPQELQTEAVEKRGILSTYLTYHAASSSNGIPKATSTEVDTSLAVQARVEGIISAEFEISSGKVGNDSVIGGGLSEACEEAWNESELVNYGRIHHSPGSTQ